MKNFSQRYFLLSDKKFQGIFSRFAKGFGAGVLGKCLNIAMRLILPPLFLRAWGVHIYGEWLVLSSIVAYLSLTDLGGQIYITNRMTELYAQQKWDQFKQVFHTGLLLFIVLPLAAFLCFSAVITFLPVNHWFHIQFISSNVTTLILVILAFGFVFSLPQGVLMGVYRAIGRLPFSVMVVNLIVLLQLIFVSLALWFKLNILMVALLQVLPFLLIAIYVLYDLNRSLPKLKVLSLKGWQTHLAKSFFWPSLNFLWIRISVAFSVQGVVIVVGIILGSIPVVIFSTMRTIVNIISMFLYLLINTFWPDLTSLSAINDQMRLKQLFTVILRTVMLGGTIIFILLYFWGATLYHFWLRGRVSYNQSYMDVFLFYAFQLIFWGTCRGFLMAINKHRALSRVVIVSTLFSFVAVYFGAYFWGLMGAIMGILVADLILPFWVVPYLVCRYDSVYSYHFFVKEFVFALVALLLVLWNPWLLIFVVPILFGWWLMAFFI